MNQAACFCDSPGSCPRHDVHGDDGFVVLIGNITRFARFVRLSR